VSKRIDLVRRAYETAAEAGYLETDWGWFFDQIATDDCELLVSRTYPDAKDIYAGRDGWIEFWTAFAEVWQTWTMEADRIYEPRERMVMALMCVLAKGHESGVSIDRREAHVWIFRGDRVRRIEAWPDRDEAYRELGLSM